MLFYWSRLFITTLWRNLNCRCFRHLRSNNTYKVRVHIYLCFKIDDDNNDDIRYNDTDNENHNENNVTYFNYYVLINYLISVLFLLRAHTFFINTQNRQWTKHVTKEKRNKYIMRRQKHCA